MYIGFGRCINLEYYNIVRHFIFIVCKVRQFWSDHIICLSSVYIRVIKREPKITGRFSLAKNKDRARFEGSAKFTRIIYFFVSACTLKNLSKKKIHQKTLNKNRKQSSNVEIGLCVATLWISQLYQDTAKQLGKKYYLCFKLGNSKHTRK